MILTPLCSIRPLPRRGWGRILRHDNLQRVVRPPQHHHVRPRRLLGGTLPSSNDFTNFSSRRLDLGYGNYAGYGYGYGQKEKNIRRAERKERKRNVSPLFALHSVLVLLCTLLCILLRTCCLVCHRYRKWNLSSAHNLVVCLVTYLCTLCVRTGASTRTSHIESSSLSPSARA